MRIAVVSIIVCALAIAAMFYFWNGSGNASAFEFKRADLPKIAERVKAIRGTGSIVDGIHTLFQKVAINNNDYYLMACDNSTARRNFLELTSQEREESRWFTADKALTGRRPWEPAGAKRIVSYNAHGSVDSDGNEYLESFLAEIPREKYQASAEEVAWHCIRLIELRKENVERAQRISIMTEEAKHKPWLKWGEK